MDKIKFAQFIGYITRKTGYQFDETELNNIDQYVGVNSTNKASCADVDELLRSMLGNEKIPAIKAYRTLTGTGLKEAKDVVEKYWVTVKQPEAV